MKVSIAAIIAAILLPGMAMANGARSFKTGPIQITADGAHLWVVNPDNDSVTHVDPAMEPALASITEFPLPDPGTKHSPRNLAVAEDGHEIWVACHDSDRVYVLAGHGGIAMPGSLVARIDLPRGSGPWGVALSRDQSRALVTCLRSGRLVFVDAATHRITDDLPTFRTPLGACFLEDGVSAWITHFRVDDRLTRMGRVDLSGPHPIVTTLHRQDGSNPQDSAAFRDVDPTHNVAEGGYLHFRGHLAQLPGGGRPWVPTQYGNVHETRISPDTTIQATLRTIDLATRTLPNTLTDKIILTAKQVHDPTLGTWIGPGWDEPFAGPADIAFSSDGTYVYTVGEQSENVVAMRADTPPERRGGLVTPPVLVDVGWRPMGIALSPTTNRGYVMNFLSRSVSVLDLTPGSETELRRLPVTPTTGERLDPATINGEHLFYTSNDPRISGNRKVACASCHILGEDDGRPWELQHLPSGLHGPRETQTLLGLSLSFGPVDSTTGLGQLHASGDRDEVQDFDHTFIGPQMGGAGFIASGRQAPLGAGPNAGLDADLDDLAAYVLQVPALEKSPLRNQDGTLTEAAVRGATFFMGAGSGRADANCAGCHVPATGFSDQLFHDVGRYRIATEQELNVRAPTWATNTPSLVGLFASPPYEGANSFRNPETLVDLLVDYRAPGRPAPHGNLANLTGRQMMDLADTLGQFDGLTLPSEIVDAVDRVPPRVVRVVPTSLSRIEVFFSESVAASAASPLAWRVREVAGPDVTVTSAQLDPQNEDRVTLFLSGVQHGCVRPTYQVIPVGPIYDRADTVTGGVANALDVADLSNVKTFDIGDTLTITLGRSGYENVTIPVHDAAANFFLDDMSHGSAWMTVSQGTNRNVAFLRFEWADAFRAATGLASATDIVDASFSLEGAWGDAHSFEARRVLQAWWDHGGPDMSRPPPTNPVSGHSGPTRKWSEYNVRQWNATHAAARTAGVEGRSVSDYLSVNDTAFTPDAIVAMTSIVGRTSVASAGVLDAYRFWYDNPSLDFGYALTLDSTSKNEVKFMTGEEGLSQHAPVLTITYRVPTTATGPRPGEVSGSASSFPLMVTKDPAGLKMSFEDLGPAATAYSVYEGLVQAWDGVPGSWYTHAAGNPGSACGIAPPPSGGRRDVVVPSTSGRSEYFLVSANDGCLESPSGFDSFSVEQVPLRLDCAP